MSRSLYAGMFVLLAAAVLLAGCKKNQLPEGASVPAGADSACTGQRLAFASSATDPDNNNVAIRFDWGNGDTSDWSALVAGGMFVTDTHSWRFADTYPVRAQARDARGARSEWSDPHTVAIAENHAPDEPRLDDAPTAIAGETLHVDAYVHDPDEHSVAIRVSWGDGDTSVWSLFVPSGEHIMLRHVYADTGTYLVQVRAMDQHGAASAWSNGWPTVTVWLPKWRYHVGADIKCCPAVSADGTVYFGSDDGYLYALDQNGVLKWRYATGGSVKSSPAVATDGAVYFGSDDGYLYVLNASGALRWRYQAGDSVRSSPALAADGTIYVGSEDGCLYAFEPSGVVKWSYQAGNPIMSSPAVAADGTVYVASIDHYLHAVDASGTLLWRYDKGWNIGESSPAIGPDGTVYFESGNLHAVDAAGARKWRYDTYNGTSSPVIGADGVVYVGTWDWGCLYAIHPDGTLKWSEFTGDVQSSIALAADGTIYVVEDGYLLAVSPDGENWKWGYKIGAKVKSSPTVGPDGTVYVGSDDGYLYAIQGNSPLADAPWPKFHHDARNTGRVGGR